MKKVEICQYDADTHSVTTIVTLDEAGATSLLTELDAISARGIGVIAQWTMAKLLCISPIQIKLRR